MWLNFGLRTCSSKFAGIVYFKHTIISLQLPDPSVSSLVTENSGKQLKWLIFCGENGCKFGRNEQFTSNDVTVRARTGLN